MSKHKDHDHKNGAAAAHEQPKDETQKPEPAANAQQDQELAKLADEVSGLKLALAEAEDKRLRTVADMDNLRKRLAKDMESMRVNIQADTLSAFLQVFDHFSMAVSAASSSNNLKSILDGMKMIDAEFARAFQEVGVEFVSSEGKDFDPNIHEAIAHEPSDKVAAGKILKQWNPACKLGARLLRPARVVVSAGPAPKADEKKD